MKQTFTSSSFDWLSRQSGSTGEYVGEHVSSWATNPSDVSLQNFLLVGIGHKLGSPSSGSLQKFRHYLNPLAWPLDKQQRLFDVGDLLDWANEDMRDTIVAELIKEAIHEGVLPIVLQCEKQAGYGLFAGTCLAAMQSKRSFFPGYVRLSPTLLTMTLDADQASVGASMFRFSKRCGQPFQCLQLGVQEAINPKSAWLEARAIEINALTLAACDEGLLLLYMQNFCKQIDQVLLSVDLDVLSEPHAPGDHRRTSFGLSLDMFLPAIRWLAGEGKLLGIEITGIGAEGRQKDRRPRLAASMTQDLLSHWFWSVSKSNRPVQR